MPDRLRRHEPRAESRLDAPLWRGGDAGIPNLRRQLPAIDLLQRAAHELRPIAVGQTTGVAKRCDALLIGQMPLVRVQSVPHMQRSIPNASMTRSTGSQMSS